MTEPAANSPSNASEAAHVPGLSDVLGRLDRLEMVLRELVDAVRSAPPAPQPRNELAPPPRQAPPAPPAINVTGQAAPGEPPVIFVAAPRARDSRQETSPTIHGPADNSLKAYDPYADRTDIEPPPPNATIHQVLTRVFEAGLAAAQEDTWAIMAKLTHPSQMQGPRALDHFKAFNWHKLRRTAPSYLRNNDPSTFTIAYTDPAEISATDDRVRVFLKVDERMPVPVGFARDKTQNNAWRVTMMSL